MKTPATLGSVLGVAERSGLDAVGVAKAEKFEQTREHLEERRGRGLASSMQFTYRKPSRSTNPMLALPGAKSIIVGALNYPKATDADSTDRQDLTARVAGYAQRDYYAELRYCLEKVADSLKEAGHTARMVLDENALVDREAARRAGLGWIGKNTCLLIPKRGSRFVLGSVITDAEFPDQYAEPSTRTCGSCTACQGACPTGALDVAGELDARKCLAWLVQAVGIFPREHRVALGDRLYGCDDCQDVCPINSGSETKSFQQPVQQFETTQHFGSSASVMEILASSDEDLISRYGRFYIPKRDPKYLRRNALLVLGNTASSSDTEVQRALQEALSHSDPIIRSHAVWAANRLGHFALTVAASIDPDCRVREEARRPTPQLAST